MTSNDFCFWYLPIFISFHEKTLSSSLFSLIKLHVWSQDRSFDIVFKNIKKKYRHSRERFNELWCVCCIILFWNAEDFHRPSHQHHSQEHHQGPESEDLIHLWIEIRITKLSSLTCQFLPWIAFALKVARSSIAEKSWLQRQGWKLDWRLTE